MTKPRNFDEVLAKLPDARQGANGEWKWTGSCPCPGHKTPKGHLSLKDEGDRVLVYCHPNGQHSAKEIAAAWGYTSLKYDTGKGGGEIEAVYKYTDMDGKPFEVVRFKPKGFYQRQPDGKGGYVWNLKGIRPTLYHHQDIVKAVANGDTVFVPEGERDADTLCGIGLVATTSPMGAGKWRDSYAETLRGADVVVMPDGDDKGRDHGLTIAASCYGKAKRVRILTMPDGIKDVTDWLNAGHTRDDFDKLLDVADTYSPKITITMKSLAAMRQEITGRGPARDVINDLLPDSPTAFCLLCGRAGIGKTFLSLQLVHCLASGVPFLSHKVNQCAVGYVSFEGADTKILERFDRIGQSYPGAEANIFWHHGLPICLRDAGIPAFKALLRGCDVVVVDPLRPLVAGDYTSPRDANTFVRTLLEIQAETQTKLILCHHIRKPDRKVKVHPDDLMYEVKGASEYVEAANTVLLLERAQQPRGEYGRFAGTTTNKLLHYVKVKDAPSGGDPLELQFNADRMVFEPVAYRDENGDE